MKDQERKIYQQLFDGLSPSEQRSLEREASQIVELDRKKLDRQQRKKVLDDEELEYGEVVQNTKKLINVRDTALRLLKDRLQEVERDLRAGEFLGEFQLTWMGTIHREAGELFVTHVRDRKTTLARPSPEGIAPKVMAANVDKVVITCSVVTPPLHPRIIDRMLIAAQRGGAEAIVVINKVDLLTSRDELQAILEPYRRAGLSVVELSTETGEGIQQLKTILSDSLCVLIGHSGVGKSSIVNALSEETRAIVGATSQAYQRGRHTTTASTIYVLDDGIRVIDTPGVRQFGLWQIDREHLPLYFIEFKPFEGGCRFNDCTHTHEPDCAIRAAVESGELSSDRYATYTRLWDSLKESQDKHEY
jgi:ribosome small subunit-dependent GTPase A